MSRFFIDSFEGIQVLFFFLFPHPYSEKPRLLRAAIGRWLRLTSALPNRWEDSSQSLGRESDLGGKKAARRSQTWRSVFCLSLGRFGHCTQYLLSLQSPGNGQRSGQGLQAVDVPPCSPPSPSSAVMKLP
ncbi:hypothetical protein MHYP_G00119730 [Metynnis hypsauchen]